jgi:galactoside O-acetyltransferase
MDNSGCAVHPWTVPNPLDPGYYVSEQLRAFGFKAVGENVRISRAANMVGPQNIEIGDNVRIDAFTCVVANRGRVKLGSHIHIASNCLIGGRGGVTFDDYSGISHGTRLFTATDDCSGHWMMSYEVDSILTNPQVAPVHVGRHAVVGANCVILPGCTLGDGAVVGAMSLVKRDLEPWAIHAGIPVRLIRPRSKNVLRLERTERFLPQEAIASTGWEAC